MSVYEEFGRLERQGWTDASRAAAYVELFSSATDQAIPPLLRAIGAAPGKRVLDLCCGHGNVACALVAAGSETVGADFSPTMISLAEDRVRGATFFEADAQKLPFEAEEFDAVVSNLGISHVPDQMRALAEVRRVLPLGGAFAMTVWCGPEVSPAYRIFREAVKFHGDPKINKPEGPDTHRFADRETAIEMLSAAGFAGIQFDTIECIWDLASPSELAEIFERATVRAAALMAQQRPDHLAAIRKQMELTVRNEFSHGRQWRVPMPAALVKAIAH